MGETTSWEVALRARYGWALLSVGFVILCCAVCRVVRNPYDYMPVWAPDGNTLAFVCYEPSAWEIPLQMLRAHNPAARGDIPYDYRDAEICTTRSNGRRTRLTRNRVPDYDPIWAPDGSRIAFVSHRDIGSDIYLMRPDGTEQTRLTYAGGVGDLAWSPVGGQLCYASGGDLWLVNVDTAVERRLTDGAAREGFPVWSPDGGTIAFIAEWEDRTEVRLLALDTGEQRVLGLASAGWTLAWSPDGRHLAFVGPTGEPGNTLYSIDIQTLKVTQLTRGDDRIHEGIAWAADGQQVFYVAAGRIYTARANGSGWDPVTELESVLAFWREPNLTLSSDGNRIALACADSWEIAKIWVVDLKEGLAIRASSGW